jgi:hypothetical protein
MAPREAENVSTPSPEELQELWDLPSEIKQRDLEEILEARCRARTTQDDLRALLNQLETQLCLGLRVEPGRISLVTAADGKRKIAWGEEEVDWDQQASIPF